MKSEIERIKALIFNEIHYERTRYLLNVLQQLVESTELADDEKRINDAKDLMLFAHFNQNDRPDGQPYINHPLDVAIHIIKEFEVFESDLIVAALLHDTVEDQPQKVIEWGSQKLEENDLESQALKIIDKNFGEKVALLVSKLTTPTYDNEIDRLVEIGKDRDELKIQFYLKHFEEIYDESKWAFTIKMADFSQNALHIDVLEESPRKNWFRRKYGPVILMVMERLENLEDNTHPLFNVKESLLNQLTKVYQRDYIAN